MTYRRFIHALIASTLLVLAPACEQATFEPTPVDETVVDITHLGDDCDWRVADSCGAGFQCDRIVDEGEYLEVGICMLSQGAQCPTPSAQGLTTEFCGRALSCQASSREREDYICLPNTCVDDSECRTGQRCGNNTCYTPGPGCGSL